MSKIGLELKVDACLDDGALAARAWIDLQPEASLWSEQELKLHAVGPGAWRASFSVADEVPTLLYRLAIATPARTYWTLTLRDAATQRLLHSDADVSPTAKFQLLGSLPLAKLRRARLDAPTNVVYLRALGGVQADLGRG